MSNPVHRLKASASSERAAKWLSQHVPKCRGTEKDAKRIESLIAEQNLNEEMELAIWDAFADCQGGK